MNNLKGIVIDPGHGGIDSGAVGNNLLEKDLTLSISKYMFDKFKSLGIPVYLTRDKDDDLTKTERINKIKSAFGSGEDVIVISNHINAGGGEGAEVIYALRNSNNLSLKILNNLAQEGQIIRKAYQRRLPTNNAKDYYYIIRETPNNESIIIEYGFIDNKKDADKIVKNYKKYVDAVVSAVLEYKGITLENDDTYTVKSGDTLWNIAKRFGLTVDKLKTLNNLTSNLLTIGQELILKEAVPGIEYIVVLGDTLYSIASKYNLSVEKLKVMNNLNSDLLKVGQKLIVDPNYSKLENEVYTVQKGDNLFQIAKKFNTTVDKLSDLNNLSTDNLSIGQKLLV